MRSGHKVICPLMDAGGGGGRDFFEWETVLVYLRDDQLTTVLIVFANFILCKYMSKLCR